MQERFEIFWIKRGGQSKSPPDPKHPNGLNVDMSRGASETCSVVLPYPAKGIGTHLVRCTVCGLSLAITAAGRADDPYNIKVACKGH